MAAICLSLSERMTMFANTRSWAGKLLLVLALLSWAAIPEAEGKGGAGGSGGHGGHGGHGHGHGGGYGFYGGYYYPGYYDYSGYRSSYYPPGDQAAPSGTAVTVTVKVPAEAEVWFDGTKTNVKGTERRFTSPPLEAGWDYTYNIRAVWMESGRAFAETRKVIVHAGDNINVEFTKKKLAPPKP
jgi:uncharacterized protein (TIGR03000 family)